MYAHSIGRIINMIDSETILISLIVLSIIVFVATTYLLSVGPNHKWYNLKMAVAIGLLGGSIAISLVTIPLALPSSDKILLPLDVWYSSQLKSYSSSSIIFSFDELTFSTIA